MMVWWPRPEHRPVSKQQAGSVGSCGYNVTFQFDKIIWILFTFLMDKWYRTVIIQCCNRADAALVIIKMNAHTHPHTHHTHTPHTHTHTTHTNTHNTHTHKRTRTHARPRTHARTPHARRTHARTHHAHTHTHHTHTHTHKHTHTHTHKPCEVTMPVFKKSVCCFFP